MGWEILAISLIAVPVAAPRFQMRQVLLLLAIFVTAIVASVIGILQYPETSGEQVKTLLAFGAALACGYVAFLVVSDMPSANIASVCRWVLFAMITLSCLEISFPAVRSLSTDLSKKWYAGDKFVDLNVSRDLALHGGIVRPLLGTQEPSWVGITLGLCLTGARIGLVPGTLGFAYYCIYALFSLSLVRSPAALMSFVAGAIYWVRVQMRHYSASPIVVFALVVTFLSGAGFLLSERAGYVLSGDEGSFNERILLPIQFTKIVLEETNGLGLGFVGQPAERGNIALRRTSALVLTAAEQAGARGAIYQYESADYPISAGHFASLTHFVYHGIPLGLLSVYFWWMFYRSVDKRLAWSALSTFAVLAICGYAYVSLRLALAQMLLVAFMTVDNSEYNEELEAEDDQESENIDGQRQTTLQQPYHTN